MLVQPPAVLLQGAAGSGKTFAVPTFIRAGIETFVIVTEPGGVESLLDSCGHHNLPIDRLHWTTCLPAPAGWGALTAMAQTIGNNSFEAIQNIKSGIGKEQTRQPALKLLNALANFQCERTETNFGDVSQWGPDRALVLDSLSGLSLIAWMLTVGYKPAAHQGEWGVAMNFVEQIVLKLTGDRACFLCVTAHIERETDEIGGTSRIMVSTLGKKLAPKLPKFFSEFVFAKRTKGANGAPLFTWSTVDSSADLKNRALPVSDSLAPDFAPVVRAYAKRLESLPEPVNPGVRTDAATPLVPPPAPLTRAASS